MSDLAPSLGPLLGPATVVVSGTNGIPWWFFQDFRGPLADRSLRSVDPDGTQASTFPRGRTLGSVVHATARVLAPGRVEVVAADRLILGEPDGADSERLRDLVGALRAGGINAQGSERIRHEVWAKLWGNMSMNPLSALTRSGTARMLASAELRELCIRMMEEMQACARPLGLEMTMTPAERIGVTQRLGDFQNLDAGRSRCGTQPRARSAARRRGRDRGAARRRRALHALGARARPPDQSLIPGHGGRSNL